MADLALLVDCGSTYTKTAAVDLAAPALLGTANAVTTVQSDVNIGIQNAVHHLTRALGLETAEWRVKLACSSAAGGLRMAAIGLAPQMTTEAARTAALGAGARVERVFSYHMSSEDVTEIETIRPDMILLAGGAEGGDRDTVIHNAALLSQGHLHCPIIYAGNSQAARTVMQMLHRAGKNVVVTENVLPEPRKLNIFPVREVIRRLFAEQIIEAKGLQKLRTFVDREVIPTPTSVLNAAQLLADGYYDNPGIGNLLLVDVGGATTDVHSIAGGRPTQLFTVLESEAFDPRVKRTVEGDLGMRVSARALIEASGPKRFNDKSGLGYSPAEQRALADALVADVGKLPDSEAARAFDRGLARCAVDIAVERHVGHVERVSTPTGALFIQEGKDLSQVSFVIGTGGVLAYSEDAPQILAEATTHRDIPSLKPRGAYLLLDRQYIFWAMGLLSEYDPNAALKLLKQQMQL